MDELSNEELFANALNDAPIETPEPETVETEDGRPRDEQGRFKAEEPAEPEAKAEPQAAPEPPKEVESVGMRQLREAFERQSRRSAELEQQLQALKPKPEAPVKPDIFENPDQFVKAGITEAITPIEQKFASLIETYSRRDAVREHGEERVNEAYGALDQAAKNGDPQALAVVQAVKQSMTPFSDIVSWYAGNEASRNPEGFFQRKLEEALRDEKFKGELMAKLNPAQQEAPKPVFKVPPSLNRAASAASSLDEGGDLSNESLFQFARS